jgi:hypothetical protein
MSSEPEVACNGLLSQSFPPVAGSSMTVSHCKDEDLFVENPIHNAEGEFAEHVSAARGEINRPTLGRFCDSRHRALEFVFEIERGIQSAFFVPGE